MRKIGFDNERYKKMQTESILKRMQEFDNKLYMEFGGKMFDDFHAARVLPGFDPNVKSEILQNLKDQIEVILCIGAPDIENNKMRADFGITYGDELIRLTKLLKERKIPINSIVITQYNDQVAADIFKKQLTRMGFKVHVHKYTKGYPNNIDVVVSDQGYGVNSYIETSKPIVIVNAPGARSGKLATCLSQLYHEYKRGNKAGYAKFETFPVWNLPIKHPVNIAYEAATVDISDRNMIDYYHFEAYGESVVNYNRDLEVFPIGSNILHKIMGRDVYKSPTDMSINMVGNAIIDDEVVQEAGKQEVIRRYFFANTEYRLGRMDLEHARRIERLMQEIGVQPSDRVVVGKALEVSKKNNRPAIALELENGKIITGKEKETINAAASVIMNAIKELAGIDDDIDLISPSAIETIQRLKKDALKLSSDRLSLEEALIALAFSAASNPTVSLALKQLKRLCNCEAHSSIMIAESEQQMFHRLGINITSEPVYVLPQNGIKN
ncbi:MAG TPA: DUF1846 domain-containing protein [Clostridiales bacterium]|nr:DUF1846 domain-containing protein [Clostridiales bacterium]